MDKLRNSSGELAKPEPRPPSANADLTIIGYPISSAALSASSTVFTAVDCATGISISKIIY